ncbi:hypothetical protein L0244_17320 [bacterium]|nr:hypothetical protein [bacterium]
MGRYKEKTTVTEKIPLDAVVDDSEPKPLELQQQQEDQEISPTEQRYLDVARRLAGYGLKFKVFRIVDSGERYIKSLTAEQFDTENPEGSLRTYFGGGLFKVYFVDPESREEISSEFEIEGEPKLVKEEMNPGTGLTLNIPKQGADATAIAMMNFMSTQLSKNQELVNALIMEMAKSKNSNQQQGALVGGMTLEQLGIIKELFASKKGDDSGEKLKEWIGLARTLVEQIAPIIQPQSDNPVMTFFSMIAPKISEVANAFIASRQGAKPPVGAQVKPAAVGATATGSATPVQQPAEGADVIRQVFEQMYFTPLLEAAKEDLDPYAMTFNFKAQLGDTTQFLPALGLTSIQAFYDRYPASQDHRSWFDEFFYFMLNPTAKPEMEEEEEEEGAKTQPANGSANDVEIEIEAEDATARVPEPKKKSKKETEVVAEQKQ